MRPWHSISHLIIQCNPFCSWVSRPPCQITPWSWITIAEQLQSCRLGQNYSQASTTKHLKRKILKQMNIWGDLVHVTLSSKCERHALAVAACLSLTRSWPLMREKPLPSSSASSPWYFCWAVAQEEAAHVGKTQIEVQRSSTQQIRTYLQCQAVPTDCLLQWNDFGLINKGKVVGVISLDFFQVSDTTSHIFM